MSGTPSNAHIVRRGEWARLVRAASTSSRGLSAARDRALVALLLFGGLHPHEVVALRVGDVNLEHGAVAAPGAKDAEPRTARVGGPGLDLLEAYLDLRPELDLEAPLFLSGTGAREAAATYEALSRLVSGAAERGGFGHRLRPTDLRHSHGVRLAELRLSPPEIARQMGIRLPTARSYRRLAAG